MNKRSINTRHRKGPLNALNSRTASKEWRCIEIIGKIKQLKMTIHLAIKADVGAYGRHIRSHSLVFLAHPFNSKVSIKSAAYRRHASNAAPAPHGGREAAIGFVSSEQFHFIRARCPNRLHCKKHLTPLGSLIFYHLPRLAFLWLISKLTDT